MFEIMKVAIVEDNPSDLAETLSALERFSKENSVSFDIQTFSNAEEFLASQTPFELGLFDIVLPEMSGMDLAHKVREEDGNMAIIFLTNLAKYAIEGYSVNASGYILKPINYFNLALSLKRALAFALAHGEEHGPIMKAAGRSFALRSVYYCEVRDHTMVFHLKKEEVSCRGALSEIEKLGNGRFSKTHASFLVNLSEVSMVSANEITLSNGEKVPLSRTKKKEFLSAMAVYLGREK